MHRKGWRRRAICGRVCIGLLLIILSGRLAFSQQPAPRDQAEAWQWMQGALYAAKAKFTNVKMENFSIYAQCAGCTSGKSFSIPLLDVASASVSYPTGSALNVFATWYAFPYISTGPGRIQWTSFFSRAAEGNAEKFQAALLYLARAARKEETTNEAAFLQDFKAKALAWQQMAVKPALPEEAQRHQVLAEYDYKNKDIPKAILEYLTALNIYAYWPDGQSNVANLCAEVGTARGYQLAVFHMKQYLMLAPNAPDAKAAQDSIFIWEDKAKTADQ